MKELLQDAVAAIFMLLFMLLGLALALSPSIILWLSMHKMLPAYCPWHWAKPTAVCLILSLVVIFTLNIELESGALSMFSQLFLLSFGWSLLLLPVALISQWWRQR